MLYDPLRETNLLYGGVIRIFKLTAHLRYLFRRFKDYTTLDSRMQKYAGRGRCRTFGTDIAAYLS